MNKSDISTALGKDGLGEQSWWVEQWMELINTYRYKKRLERAWEYARQGNVTSIQFEGRRVHARVQGTESKPYKVKLWLDVLNEEDWKYVIQALAQKAKWSAQLLAGVMPKDIEKAFAASGKRLFPFNLQEVKSECSCPDQANPCKHISAIYFLMGDQFKEDPFILFQLRGRSKNTLISELEKKRHLIIQDNIKDITNSQKIGHKIIKKSTQNNWSIYKHSLDEDLVVITPSESIIGIKAAGDLPLAKDPQFPDSHQIFIENIYSHGEKCSQEAMMTAMAIKNFK